MAVCLNVGALQQLRVDQQAEQLMCPVRHHCYFNTMEEHMEHTSQHRTTTNFHNRQKQPVRVRILDPAYTHGIYCSLLCCSLSILVAGSRVHRTGSRSTSRQCDATRRAAAQLCRSGPLLAGPVKPVIFP